MKSQDQQNIRPKEELIFYSFEEWCEYHHVQLENTMRDDLIRKSADKFAISFANWLYKKQAESEKRLVAFSVDEKIIQLFKDEK